MRCASTLPTLEKRLRIYRIVRYQRTHSTHIHTLLYMHSAHAIRTHCFRLLPLENQHANTRNGLAHTSLTQTPPHTTVLTHHIHIHIHTYTRGRKNFFISVCYHSRTRSIYIIIQIVLHERTKNVEVIERNAKYFNMVADAYVWWTRFPYFHLL